MSLCLEVHWEMFECWLWSHRGHWTGLVCASSCCHEESPLHFNSLTRDLFCISVQEQFVHLWIVLEQFGSSLLKGSLLLLPHCRFFSGTTYPDHTFPAAGDRNCSTQRQARWNMQYCYRSVSLRLFPVMHMMQSTSSRIHPIFGELLSQEQGCTSITLAF